MSAGRRDPTPSLLDQVLPKLRPFQREAVEFATEGKLYERQFSGTSSTNEQSTTTDRATLRCASTTKENTTKLLLADEMGLGKVRRHKYGIEACSVLVFAFTHSSRFSFSDCNVAGNNGLL
jgi:hypothetical protein